VFLSLSGGKFAPKEIQIGPSDINDDVQVLSGLAVGQTIVTSAQFLIDSESKLKEAINKMIALESGQSVDEAANEGTDVEPGQVMDEESGEGTDEVQDDNEQTTSTEIDYPNLAPDDPNAKFVCPMPDDKYYAAEDGDCPICGMHLEPHDPEAWAAEHKSMDMPAENESSEMVMDEGDHNH